MRHPRSVPITRLVRAAVAVVLLAGLATTPALAVEAPAGLTIEANVLMDGHVRVGSWMAIDIHVANTGPAISGELRLAGGAQGRTRFGTRVDLPTQSDKTYRLYAQPPAFGRELEISLVDGDRTVATTKATFTVHDATQLVVGIVAEQPGDIVGDLDLLPNQNSVAPADRAPDRRGAARPRRGLGCPGPAGLAGHRFRGPHDRTDRRVARLGRGRGPAGHRRWNGRTGQPCRPSRTSSCPYRPTATIDVEPEALVALLGELPATATTLPALSGELTEGRPLATSGDRTVAAERAYGSGSVTIVGFDPTASWIAGTSQAEGMWRRLLPTRSSGGPIIGDDSQIVSAATQMPSLALPPIGGLIALLGAYILLIGPINYLVLRRLDRREWAWVTMPVLIVAFAAGAYGFGSLLRGSDLIVNEVAIVRGAPGTTDGAAQIYLGVFSPSRGTYQLRVPGGALLSSPTAGDFLGGDGTTATLDVLQGDPAQVRDLGVGFGSLRTVRAETAVAVPLVQADLRLEDGRLRGTVTNASDEVLLKPVVVLGGTVAKMSDLAPGASETIDVKLQAVQMGQQLSDRIVGPVNYGESGPINEGAARLNARNTIINQLTFDPAMGFTGQLPTDGPVVLAWADRELLPVEIQGATPRRTGNVLWFLPTELSVSGTTTFRNDLLRSTVIKSDAAFFSKDPFTINFGRGSAELSYRPIAFDGTLTATELAIGLNFGEPGLHRGPQADRAAPLDPRTLRRGAGRGLPGAELRRAAGGRAVRPVRRRLEAAAPPRRRRQVRRRRARPLRGPGDGHRADPARQRQ